MATEEKPHPLDACYCGDFRYQHAKGGGRCLLGDLCTPTPCQKFRFFHGPSEDELENHPTHGRNSKDPRQ
jgi:hypothetical protein